MTTNIPEPFVDGEIARLEADLRKLRAWRQVCRDHAYEIAAAFDIYGDWAGEFFLRGLPQLDDDAPIDLLLRGEVQRVRDLLWAVEGSREAAGQ